MTPELWLAFVGLFVSIALITGVSVSAVLARNAPERRRLRDLVAAGAGTGSVQQVQLVERVDPRIERLARAIPKSPKEMNRLRRRLATAGVHSYSAAVFYAAAELVMPVVVGGLVFHFVPGKLALILGIAGAFLGFMLPGITLSYLIAKRKRRIENGLPDALDLMIVCIEAGCSLDQAVLKASNELEISHPDLAAELSMITTEIRAGKPRLEAFKNFADRTKVDDVRALVAMLVQTDRFGTSVAQALRTHAATSRTKRRQRAEERAAKVGVKLVFPLVFFLFPAFYVVTLGPAVIQFVRVFFGQVVGSVK